MKQILVLASASLATASAAVAQAPEIMWFQFDGGTAANLAAPGYGAAATTIDVGFPTATTCGGNGLAAEALSSSTEIATNWTVDLGTSDWTVGMMIDLNPAGNGFQYFFGSSSASSFRCFGNGAAGQDGIMLRSPGGDITIPGATALGAPKHIVFVYDSSVPEIRGYIDGVLQVTQPQSSLLDLNGTAADFYVMRYTSGMLAGNLMDEFRFYRRALGVGEIASWGVCAGGNGPIGNAYCAAVPNSTGVPTSLTATGSDFAAANSVLLEVADLPQGAWAVFLAGDSAGNTPGFLGSSGTYCLSGVIGRHLGPGQVQNSGATGEVSLQADLTQMPQGNGTLSVMAGETWHFQVWHRDAVGGAATSNFSNGLEITFQ
ncbi:MAG: LamG-like jellyroll fold domain-containing protein [Planctomycetota bacterium]